jgi:hypothetical protein
MSMEDLSSVLWRERELLETLLFKLEVEQLVLATGRTRWLPTAAREIEEVLDAIRETELLRGIVADEVASTLGLAPNPSLQQIADASDEPWRSIWLDHRETFTSVSAEITAMAENNRELLTSGYQAAKATLLSLSDTPATYTADGSTVTERRTNLVDRSI